MTFRLHFSETAIGSLRKLKHSADLQKRYKAVTKALTFLSQNPKHPSLQTHKYTSLKGPNGEEIIEAYAEQDTPAAYRIFFFYGPGRGEITIFAVRPLILRALESLERIS